MYKKLSVIVCVLALIFACDPPDNKGPSPEEDASVIDSSVPDAALDVADVQDGNIIDALPDVVIDSSIDSSSDVVIPELPIPYRGVCLSGAEWGSALPGKENVDYYWPNNGEIDYFMSKGMNTFRIGFSWERIQSTANGNFVVPYANKLDGLVTYATSKGAYVILNPHNFARYYGNTVGSTQVPNSVFADFWSRLANKYKGNSKVFFNLVNEPNTMPTEQWVSAANAAIAAIRSAGAKNLIIVPGNAWTGAHSWASNWYGTPNAVALLNISDSENNIVFEAHQYLDSDSSGGGGTCSNSTIGKTRLIPFINWLKTNGKKGFIGEFGAASNATCNAAIVDMLQYMSDNADVLVGWLWWAGGPRWGDSYILGIDPRSDGKDAPQMHLLIPFL